MAKFLHWKLCGCQRKEPLPLLELELQGVVDSNPLKILWNVMI